jgi:sugar phosphate permease
MRGANEKRDGFMAKDFKENRRGCFVIAAIVALLVAALAFAILRTGDDPRSNGIAPRGGASPPATGAAAPVPIDAVRHKSRA